MSTISAPISALSVWSTSLVRSTDAKAIWPARGPAAAIWWAPSGEYGLVTLTPSISSTAANSSSIAACTSGSSTPCSAANTMEPPKPLPWPSKWAFNTSTPWRLSLAGISKELS